MFRFDEDVGGISWPFGPLVDKTAEHNSIEIPLLIPFEITFFLNTTF